jgi:hypothetical protein
MRSPKAPKPTAEAMAAEIRTRRLLDEEIEENERRVKAMARAKGVSKSLRGSPVARATRGTAQGMSRLGRGASGVIGVGGRGSYGGGASGRGGYLRSLISNQAVNTPRPGNTTEK